MLSKYVNVNSIFINPDVNNKNELFLTVANSLYKNLHISDKNTFITSLKDRENLANTEVLPGIAIPHTTCHSVKNVFLSIIIIKDGLDYGNPQLGKVKIVFLIGSHPTKNKTYLKLLATTARLLKNNTFHNELLSCSTPEEIISLLNEYSEDYENEDSDNYMLIIHLYKAELIHDVINTILEVGIGNASVVSSSSLGKKVSQDIPIFAGLKLKSHSGDVEIKVILAIISDINLPKKIMTILKKQGYDFEQPGYGYMHVFKLKAIIGHPDELI